MARYPSDSYGMPVRFKFSGLLVDDTPRKPVSLINTGVLKYLQRFL